MDMHRPEVFPFFQKPGKGQEKKDRIRAAGKRDRADGIPREHRAFQQPFCQLQTGGASSLVSGVENRVYCASQMRSILPVSP